MVGLSTIVIVYSVQVFYLVFSQERSARFVSTPYRIPSKLCPYRDPVQVEEKSNQSFQQYKEQHHRIMAEKPENQRFLVWEAGGYGLGNRILSLLSAFLLANLTNRALIVDWKSSPACSAPLADLFMEPGFQWDLVRVKDIVYPDGIQELVLQFRFFFIPQTPILRRKCQCINVYK